MSDAPQRRRANAPSASSSSGPGIKKFRVPMIIVAIWALIIAFNVAQAQGLIGEIGEECPGHWHAGYSVWVDDQPVQFSNAGPGGSAQSSPGAGFHIHGNDGTLHFHPGAERCIPLGDALEKLEVEIDGDSLVLGQTTGVAGTYMANETKEVVVYHQEWSKEWKRVGNVDAFFDDQLGNGDRLMIAYQDAGTDVTPKLNATTDLSGGNYEPTTPSTSSQIFIPVMMATIFAGIGLALWYNFASKTW